MRAHTSCIFPKHDFWPFVDDDGVAAMISKLKKACCCLKVEYDYYFLTPSSYSEWKDPCFFSQELGPVYTL